MRDVRRIGLGRGLRGGGGGGAEKEWIGCFLDELRVFGINAHQWTGRVKERRG